MKRKFLGLVAAILAFCVSASIFTGCDLIVVDNQKDMDLVVAEVSIGEDAPTEKIYKKDLIVLYMNYGYYYVQNYGYTMKQTFELLMSNLVNNVLLVQNAVEYFAEKDGVSTDKYDLTKYLDDAEEIEALYLTNKSFNDLIENYKEVEEETEEKETSTGEVRTVPTGATNYAEDYEGIDKFWEDYLVNNPNAEESQKETEYFKDYNKKGFLNKGIVTGFDDNFNTNDIETKKAYEQVLKALDVNGLLGEDFDFKKGSIYDTEYYKDTLENQYETVLLEKYEKELKKQILESVSYADLDARYKETYKAQSEKNATDYDTLLSDASATSPVLYYKDLDGYGYIYNLLLGINDVQSAQINELKAKKTSGEINEVQYANLRKEILSATTVKDLRSSWITAGYDFDYNTGRFLGDYSSKEVGLAFQGEVEWINEDEKDNDDYVAEYEVTSVKEETVGNFVKFMEEYIYGETQMNMSTSWYKTVEPTSKPDDYEEKINELLFAYSTDPGSLNTYKGYLVKSKVVVGASETYVKEFADASREVIDMKDGSYIIVETDYGYHVIFKSQKVSSSFNAETLDAYLDKNANGVEKTGTWAEYFEEMKNDIDAWAEDNDTDFYLYQIMQAYTANVLDAELTEVQNAIVCKYKEYDEETKTYGDYKKENVKLYTDRYSEYLIEQ